jgi:hypothetical protein
MKKFFTLLCILFMTSFLAQAQNASFNWSLCGGGATGADRSADVVTDASGNIFTANTILNTATFNGITATGSLKGSGANYDNCLFINKISPVKTTLWTIYSNVGVVTPTAMATTAAGDLIVTGTMRPVINTASQTTTANIIDGLGTVTTFNNLTASSINQSFVAKFNSSGAIQWVQEINSGIAKDKVVTTTAIAVDASGNIYVTGIFPTTVVFPGSSTIYTSTNTTQAAFIAKLDGTTGNEVWNKTSTGGIVQETLPGLVYGDDGYLYAAGIYRNAATPVAVTIGDKSFTPSAGYDLTLIKFDTDGNLSYIQSRLNAGDTRVKDITQSNGKVFVAGSFKGSITFSTALTNSGTLLNGFTAAFNATDGSDSWQKGVFSAGIDETYGLVVGRDGRLYAFGAYGNKSGSATATPVDFGDSKSIPDTNPTNSSADLFLVSYNVANGTTLELHSVATSSAYETANSLACTPNHLYLLGTTNASPVTFENASTYTTLGAYDILLIDYKIIASGINSFNQEKLPFSYFDNPNRFIVVKNAEQVTYVKLLDTTGRIIKTSTNSNNTLNIGTQNISPGVYILQLTTSDKKIISQRLIIQ